MSTPVSELYIHHSAGASPPDLPASKNEIEKRGERATVKGFQNYHMDSKGWADIAYNFIIMPSGRVYRGRGWKRQGAHTEGRNDRSVAFCFAGNFEVEKPTDKALKSARKLRQKGIQERRLTPTVRTAGHRAAPGASTACPGQHLVNRIKEIG
jgi:hypothetical protein